LLGPLGTHEREVAASPCHIGQPVSVGRDGVLRVAASARLAGEDGGAVEDALAQVFQKIRLMLRNLPRIEAAF
jgi:hypothetical protein